MHKRCLCSHAVSTVFVRLCVRVSVTFVDSVETNKHIFKIFFTVGIHAILVFPYEMAWHYSDGNHPNEGVECRWGRVGRNRDYEPISGFTPRC